MGPAMLPDALERMPHAGAMRLIAAIEAADATHIRCRAADHVASDYPLRLDGVLFAAALVELGAQAAAAHASVFGLDAAHTGLVLAISDLALLRDRVEHPEPLLASAERLHQLGGAAAYRFAVSQGGAPLVTGEVLLSMVPA
jgi:predicted hotdog family 3-hydroxylacyl-ACP dehydratase